MIALKLAISHYGNIIKVKGLQKTMSQAIKLVFKCISLERGCICATFFSTGHGSYCTHYALSGCEVNRSITPLRWEWFWGLLINKCIILVYWNFWEECFGFYAGGGRWLWLGNLLLLWFYSVDSLITGIYQYIWCSSWEGCMVRSLVEILCRFN